MPGEEGQEVQQPVTVFCLGGFQHRLGQNRKTVNKPANKFCVVVSQFCERGHDQRQVDAQELLTQTFDSLSVDTLHQHVLIVVVLFILHENTWSVHKALRDQSVVLDDQRVLFPVHRVDITGPTVGIVATAICLDGFECVEFLDTTMPHNRLETVLNELDVDVLREVTDERLAGGWAVFGFQFWQVMDQTHLGENDFPDSVELRIDNLLLLPQYETTEELLIRHYTRHNT
ncbi:hypothetical protein D3C81_190890 [compost metagenome]